MGEQNLLSVSQTVLACSNPSLTTYIGRKDTREVAWALLFTTLAFTSSVFCFFPLVAPLGTPKGGEIFSRRAETQTILVESEYASHPLHASHQVVY